MKETLYRRNADGVMETVVPEARGKAAAFDRWLAQGGTPFRVSGKFKQGPMKGMTYDQAKQKFEGMWASSPDAIKEKYASRSATDLAPSERQIPGIQPTPKPNLGVQGNRMRTYADQKQARMSYYQGDKAAADAMTPKTPTTPRSVPQGPPAPGSDEARAAAFRENSGNEQFATADTGDGGMMAALAMREQSYGPDGNPAPPLGSRRSPEIDRLMKPKVVPVNISEGDAGRANEVLQHIGSKEVVKPGLQPSNEQPEPAPLPARTSEAVSQPSPPATPATGSAPKGVAPRITIGKPAPINSTTGLPMGYRPGDSVAPAQADAAAQSVRDQEQAQNAAFANAPRAIPVIKPVPLRDQHTAAVADYQKDLDPAKFAKVNAIYNGGTDLEKAQMASDTLKRSAPLARRDSALAAAARKPMTVATRPQFARR